MDIVEIRIGAAHTINLGNYESTRIEAGLTISIKEGDDLNALRPQMQATLRSFLEETFKAQQRKRRGTTEGNGA